MTRKRPEIAIRDEVYRNRAMQKRGKHETETEERVIRTRKCVKAWERGKKARARARTRYQSGEILPSMPPKGKVKQ